MLIRRILKKFAVLSLNLGDLDLIAGKDFEIGKFNLYYPNFSNFKLFNMEIDPKLPK